MYTLPISDTKAIAVDDSDPESWQVYQIDFSTRQISSFSVEGLGNVAGAHYDHGRGLLWVIVEGTIFAVQIAEQEIFEVPTPDEEFFVYCMVGEGPYVYVGGEYSNLWRIALPALEWEPLRTPAKKPARSSDKQEQTRRVTEYAAKHPPFYFGFEVGKDFVFCGALGTLARVRGRMVEIQTLETGARLVTGRVEGAQISLSADSPAGEIYLGDFDLGFEMIFADNLRALHRTAIHEGQHYIGVAEYPSSDVTNLYVRDQDGLVPVETDCAREPMPLISLSTIGATLWAVDEMGVFRHTSAGWELIDIEHLEDGSWPVE